MLKRYIPYLSALQSIIARPLKRRSHMLLRISGILIGVMILQLEMRPASGRGVSSSIIPINTHHNILRARSLYPSFGPSRGYFGRVLLASRYENSEISYPATGSGTVFDATGPPAPVISNLDGDFDSFIEDGSPLLLDAGTDTRVKDGDSPDFNGGNLTASIISHRQVGEDVLKIESQGQISVSGNIVSFEGNAFGSFHGGTGTDDLVVNFTNSAATPAAAEALIRALSYLNPNSTLPSAASRTISITLNDGDGLTSAAGHGTVLVAPHNDPPTMSAAANFRTFTEGGSPVTNFFSGGNKVQYTVQRGAAGKARVTITVTDDGGTSNGGVDHLSRSFSLTVNPLPVVAISNDPGSAGTNPVSKGILTHLTASGADSYQWANSQGIVNGWNGAVLGIGPQRDATYTVTGTTVEGCSANEEYAVQIVTDYKLVCNNIISPNGDGKNDTWIIQNIDSYPINEVKVFDRSGRMIYHKENYDNQWNGMLNGGPLHKGTYYYVFIVDGGKKIFKGYITLLK